MRILVDMNLTVRWVQFFIDAGMNAITGRRLALLKLPTPESALMRASVDTFS
jgi:predicted nuclease of predicted toxin-antitoxin system